MILAFVPDLMDRSKFAGLDVKFVAKPDAVRQALAEGEPVDLVVLDLSREGAIDLGAEIAPMVKTVGFAGHTASEVLAGARQAGLAGVFARSRFFSHLNEICS